MTQTHEAPPLAPIDSLGREIQRILELVRPRSPEYAEPRYAGYGDAASEAYLHLARARGAGAPRVMRHKTDEQTHWWLTDGAGRIIDLTLAPADRRRLKIDPGARYPYEGGRGAMFRTGPNRPSKRAAAIIALVRSGAAEPARA